VPAASLATIWTDAIRQHRLARRVRPMGLPGARFRLAWWACSTLSHFESGSLRKVQASCHREGSFARVTHDSGLDADSWLDGKAFFSCALGAISCDALDDEVVQGPGSPEVAVIFWLAIIIVGSSLASLLIARWMRRRSVQEMPDNSRWGELAWELRDLDDAETRILLSFVRRIKKGRDPYVADGLASGSRASRGLADQDSPLPISGVRKRGASDDPSTETATEKAS
jgi:hypothetical protein